jgi:hypothetical protein
MANVKAKGKENKENFKFLAQAIKKPLIPIRHSPGIAPARRTM